ncbi:MAG: nucleotidyl transferase AbiEii/AbiGii toxin family protein [Bacilli bacterium]|nr:nucleotidyl transferase AbiEii/AbiGii toxin family protein [Bacilli bacterium]
MIKNRDSLKAKVSNLSKKTGIPNQYIIYEYLFELFLRRLSKSSFRNQFIVKGGLLVSNILGINLRSTMDLDITMKDSPLSLDNLKKIMEDITSMNDDNVTMKIENIKEIRLDDRYPGFCVNLKVYFDSLKANLLIDVTTGDSITFSDIEYKYKSIFDDDYILIRSYNIETILAEKFETIISRNIDNTRMKDFYDLFMLVKTRWNEIDEKTLSMAIKNTSITRGTNKLIEKSDEIINLLKDDPIMIKQWYNYSKNYIYAKDISYDEIIETIKLVNNLLKSY